MRCLVCEWIFVLYLDSHQSWISLQIGAGVCVVPTADAVACGKVSCYNFIIKTAHFDNLWRWSARGTLAQWHNPWLARINLDLHYNFVSCNDGIYYSNLTINIHWDVYLSINERITFLFWYLWTPEVINHNKTNAKWMWGKAEHQKALSLSHSILCNFKIVWGAAFRLHRIYKCWNFLSSKYLFSSIVLIKLRNSTSLVK